MAQRNVWVTLVLVSYFVLVEGYGNILGRGERAAAYLDAPS